MTEDLVQGARSGNERAFRELTEPYRGELRFHCYRLLGSVHDADDLLQETFLAAWRGMPAFRGEASVRAWLYRIATNRCLNALRTAGRRATSTLEPPFPAPAPTRLVAPPSIEPYPDALLRGVADQTPGPDTRYEAREAIELAFIAALQRLPARQRAALVLRDVLGFQTSEVAKILESSEASVKGALQRARASLGDSGRPAGPNRSDRPASAQELDLARRFADAFVADDIAGVVALLTRDARLTMPPSWLEYQGPAGVALFLQASVAYRGRRRFHVIETRANTQPAFGLYVDDPDSAAARPTGLIVLTHSGGRISAITRFLDPKLFAAFGLPRVLRRPAATSWQSSPTV